MEAQDIRGLDGTITVLSGVYIIRFAGSLDHPDSYNHQERWQMSDQLEVSVHRLREAVGPKTVLPVRKVMVALEGNDYHIVYALLLTPEQVQRITEAVEDRGVL